MTPDVAQPTRRTLTRNAAWMVPALTVAAAAPSRAVSPGDLCSTTTDYTTAFWGPDDLNVQNPPTPAAMVYSGAASSPKVSSLSYAPVGTSIRFRSRTGASVYDNVGNQVTTGFGGLYPGKKFLMFDVASANSSSYVQFDITFAAPVYCLSFWVTDIDTLYCPCGSNLCTGSYADRVTVSSTVDFTASTTGPNLTVASGAVASALPTVFARPGPATCGGDLPPTDSSGNVCFSSKGPVTSFQLRYYNANPSGPYNVNYNVQQVYISPLRYTGNGTCICAGCATS